MEVYDKRDGPAFRGLRVLLVEDNIVNQRLAARLLRALDLRSDVASDGLAALSLIRVRGAFRRFALRCTHTPFHSLPPPPPFAQDKNQDYDVVLMDVDMPRMDGLRCTAEIRSSVADARQPWIVALTASAMEDDRVRCFAAGMDDFLVRRG